MHGSLADKVEKSIYARPRGSIFFRNNFSSLGSATAIRQALNRLEKKGTLIRLAQGIYLYPKKHKTLGVRNSIPIKLNAESQEIQSILPSISTIPIEFLIFAP